jgi:ethanolamine ammonia-lyase small subunit
VSGADLPEPAAASAVTEDRWAELRSTTAARIALGRAGASLPTRAVLEFELAHARARDAVHAALDVAALCAQLRSDAWDTVEVRSSAADRNAYLARPDWGRRLHADAAAALVLVRPPEAPDVVIVASDGLSPVAAQLHVVPLLHALRPLLATLAVAPVVIATQARVALADEAGAILGARLVISLIGERPGLSAADSLGAYLTFGPRIGRSDAERNCVSNIRPGGLGFVEAAAQIAALAHAALRQQVSGVHLKPGGSNALDYQF